MSRRDLTEEQEKMLDELCDRTGPDTDSDGYRAMQDNLESRRDEFTAAFEGDE